MQLQSSVPQVSEGRQDYLRAAPRSEDVVTSPTDKPEDSNTNRKMSTKAGEFFSRANPSHEPNFEPQVNSHALHTEPSIFSCLLV